MADKLDWRKAEPGRGGADELTGLEWRRGPVDADLSLPDISHFDLAATPNIDWSRILSARFGADDDGGHIDMMEIARRTVAQVQSRYGTDTLKTRARQFRERASWARPFPSLWFAFYFDFFAGRMYRHVRPKCLAAKSRDKYFTLRETDFRWRMTMKKFVGYDVLLEMRERAAGRSEQTGKPRKSRAEAIKDAQAWLENYRRSAAAAKKP